jgi:hypothetical protein
MSEATVDTRTLPAPAIDPADVLAVMPSLTIEQATLAAQLATVAVGAVLWPEPIPPTPTPEPVYAVLLSSAVRFGTAIAQGTALPVVSESIGSYSYRVAQPATLPTAFGLTAGELEALEPWTSHDTAYDVSTAGALGSPLVVPVDWWQRNLDNVTVP